MDIAELAKGYLNYSSWFIKIGSKIEDENKAKRHVLEKKYEGEGLTEREASLKVLKEVPLATHPDEEIHDEAVCLIEKADDDGWELLKAIVNLCPNDESLLGFIGAGVFENWVTMGYFSYTEELKGLIQTDPKWRTVAASSWNNTNDLNDFFEHYEPNKK